MTIKLQAETLVTIHHADMVAILTERLCEGSYGAFSSLEVTVVSENDDGDGFSLVLSPRKEKEPA